MKKKFSWLTSLVLVFVLVLSAVTVSAAANKAELKADKNVVQPGDVVTVSVIMNEAVQLKDMTTVFQLELEYDSEAVTYSSHKVANGYDFLDVVVSEDAPVIKAYWIYLMDLDLDFDVEGEIDEEAVAQMFANVSADVSNPDGFVRELPAGTVLSVSFTVKDSIDAEELTSSLVNSFTMAVDGDISNTFGHSYTIKVCPGHADADKDDACDNCGEGMVMTGDVNGDGKINARDAMLALRYVAGEVDSSAVNMDALDANNDGKHNARDAMLILRYVAGEITVFPLS